MRQTLQIGPVGVVYEGSKSTQVFLLLGSPVAHSLSPVMQTAAFLHAGLQAVYVGCEVTPPQMPAVLHDLGRLAASGRIGGANVTLPHKTAVAALVGALDADAEASGAVNTLRWRTDAAGGRLVGHNTDVTGVGSSLAASGIPLAGARVAVLGTGGMARAAVVAALVNGAAEIRVAGRGRARAREMLDMISTSHNIPLRWFDLSDAPDDLLEGTDVLVQATRLGMRPDDPSPIRFGTARPPGVLEAVYGTRTAFQAEAEALGLRVVSGLELLVHQGAAAFELWTGRPAPVPVMRRSLGLE